MTYSIPELIKTFKKHAEESKANNRKMRREFKENYPNEEIPAHFNEDFHIADALHSICIEIDKLKKIIK